MGMTGYNTVRGVYMRNRSDGSVRQCVRWLRRCGIDEVKEGSVVQDKQGYDLFGEIASYQHKSQFAVDFYNINIQVHEWNKEHHPEYIIWHHNPTGHVMLIPTILVINDYTLKRLITNSNQPFYTIPATQFFEKWDSDWTKAIPYDGILISHITSSDYVGVLL
jgi:hypothetical protein